MAQMLAAASIKVTDALFGFLAQNDAERSRLELLGRTWRRDWAMRQFHRFSGIPEKIWKIRKSRKKSDYQKIIWNWMLWVDRSASFCATEPNKASMTLMLAAASIWATDALERHLAPPGFQCCERDLLGRSKPRD